MPRSIEAALFVTGLLWVGAASIAAGQAADGIGARLGMRAISPLLDQVFFLFLLLVGFTMLNWVAVRDRAGVRELNALPERMTAKREWMTGAVVGWAALLLALVPMVLVGDLHPQFWLGLPAWGLTLVSVVALAAGTLALEVAFRGYLLRRMIAAAGPSVAVLVLALVYGLWGMLQPNHTGVGVAVEAVFGLLLGMAYLRTHALWAGWGLHFAWAAATALMFGLPVHGVATFVSPIETAASGRDWVSGGAFGPEGALWTIPVLLLAMLVLYNLTRDFAWAYTLPEIVPGGYPVEAKPPAAHTAMEQAAAARPAPLVQILSSTPAGASTMAEVRTHLAGAGGAGETPQAEGREATPLHGEPAEDEVNPPEV